MQNILAKLTKRETSEISQIYGLWEFVTENLENNGVSFIVSED
jgi:hypothetical protein